jgi:hydrogenase maturation protein HypF
MFKGMEAEILSKLMDKSPQISSLGRVLDAVSCYLNICCERTFDGEPAMKLERYLANGKPKYSFDVDVKNGVIGTIDLFRQLDEKINKFLSGQNKADYAYSFIKSIIDQLSTIAIDYAKINDIKNIGLSGGVTYNTPINEMIEKQVKKAGLKLVVHNKVPNGDGGIAIGQNAIIGNK